MLLYRDVRERPAEALDRICAHLGVRTGLLDALPAENVTAHASASRVNEVLGHVVRTLTRLPLLPVPRALTGPVERFLQREQRLRVPLTTSEREALLPAFAEDIPLVEELTGFDLGHWRDPRNGTDRSPLTVSGPFGTGHRSIDRPL